MKILSLALLGVCGCIGTASIARADDLSVDVGLGFRDGRLRGGVVGVEYGTDGHRGRGPHRPVISEPIRTVPPRRVEPYRPFDPVIVTDPVGPYRPGRPHGPGKFFEPGFPPHAGHDDGRGDDCACARTYIPPRMVAREEIVCVPAVYDDRCVPVYETRIVPIYETVRVPITQVTVDPRTGRRREVVIGERQERVQVGERTERVQVGERHERVLVQPETTRVVTRYETVPGRWVTLCDGRHPGGHVGEVLSTAAYRRELDATDRAPRHGPAGDGAERFGPGRPGRGADADADAGWYTGERR